MCENSNIETLPEESNRNKTSPSQQFKTVGVKERSEVYDNV